MTGLIKGYGEAMEKLESGSAERPPGADRTTRAGERVAGYLAQAGMRITIRDFTVLGELIMSLADAELVTVAGRGAGVALRPDSPVYREARLAAARDATVRAGEYAEAFGGRLGDLLEAADTGLLTAHARPDTWRFSGGQRGGGPQVGQGGIGPA